MIVLGTNVNYMQYAAHTGDAFNLSIHISRIDGLLKTSEVKYYDLNNILYGDVNGDGKGMISDLTKLQLYLNMGCNLKNKVAADMNRDGKSTAPIKLFSIGNLFREFIST